MASRTQPGEGCNTGEILDLFRYRRFNATMTFPRGRVWRWAGIFVAACILAVIDLKGADIVASPEEVNLRAAIAAAQPGDTVHLVSAVLLSSPLRIDKPITLYGDPSQNYRIFLHGFLDTELLQIGADGIILHGL